MNSFYMTPPLPQPPKTGKSASEITVLKCQFVSPITDTAKTSVLLFYICLVVLPVNPNHTVSTEMILSLNDTLQRHFPRQRGRERRPPPGLHGAGLEQDMFSRRLDQQHWLWMNQALYCNHVPLH